MKYSMSQWQELPFVSSISLRSILGSRFSPLFKDSSLPLELGQQECTFLVNDFVSSVV